MDKNITRYKPYINGFIISLLATFGAYIVATKPYVVLDGPTIGLLVGFAVVQLVAQVFYFLHLGKESRPRWNLSAFLLMVMVVAFIVVGSIWIMHNLNYNMMIEPMLEKMLTDEGLHL